MALTLPADAGEPMSVVLVAGAEVKRHRFPAVTRQILLRNTGTNTLWLSLDGGESWWDVAAGTSWDDRAVVREILGEGASAPGASTGRASPKSVTRTLPSS